MFLAVHVAHNLDDNLLFAALLGMAVKVITRVACVIPKINQISL